MSTEPTNEANFEMMLVRLVHATRDSTEPKVRAIRAIAQDLLQRKGGLNPIRDVLRAIKKEALTCTNGAAGLSHITRLCIDAGITEHLPEL